MPDYEFRDFKASQSDGAVAPDTAGWIQAVIFGFHGPNLTNEQVKKYVDLLEPDDMTLRGAYAKHTPRHAWDADAPIATFGDFEKTVNVGYGKLVPAHLISFVTVRPTHRRQGLLRAMMTDNLERAVAAGHSLAALTVSEGSIYRRFGFGPATHNQSISVDTDHRFVMTHMPKGWVEVADAAVLKEVGPQVFEKFHGQNPGSVGRQAIDWSFVSGEFDEKTGEQNRKIRAALHYDESGQVDGYTSYEIKHGDARTLSVLDMVAENSDAYLGLWKFLASIDLINKVTFDQAPVHNPLPWALQDPRVVQVNNHHDLLWLRILDVADALEKRRYAADGVLTLQISDAMGHAAGDYRLEVSDGEATVTTAEGVTADVAMDVSDLSSIYLGDVNPTVLAGAGRIDVRTAGAELRTAAMFAMERPTYSITNF